MSTSELNVKNSSPPTLTRMNSRSISITEYGLETLSELMEISKAELSKNLNKKLVDLGVDSLTISRLHASLSPAPSFLELYTSTVRSILPLVIGSSLGTPVALESLEGCKSPVFGSLQDDMSAFGLMEMQESYYIGRYESNRFCPCQIYTEFDFNRLNILTLERALVEVGRTHPMLRARLVGDQLQQVEGLDEESERWKIRVVHGADLEKRREECMTAFQRHPDLFWTLEATRQADGSTRLHVLLDMIFLDAGSCFQICRDLVDVYNSMESGMSGNVLDKYRYSSSFMEYCRAKVKAKESQQSHQYWMEKVSNMPGPPQLPRASLKTSQTLDAPFRRESLSLESERWNNIKSAAKQLGVTPTSFILCAFYEVLRAFSHEPDFTLTITISDRQCGSQNYNDVVGDFTNVLLCSVLDGGRGFTERVRQIHEDLTEGLQHKDMSGLKVMRLLREKSGDSSFILPVVFTSLLGMNAGPHDLGGVVPKLAYQQTQTPQVWFDHQVYELGHSQNEKQLCINWDYDTLFYSPALMERMMGVYKDLLNRLSNYDIVELINNRRSLVNLSPDVYELRCKNNSTTKVFQSNFLLHKMIDYKKNPHKQAVVDQEFEISYKTLHSMVQSLASTLLKEGVKVGDIVAVVMEKGWEQVVAVLSILTVGGIYLPINPSDPDQRINSILTRAECTVVLSQSKVVKGRAWKREDNVVIEVSEKFLKDNPNRNEDIDTQVDPDSVAYIIFTSGTEGQPKGVQIGHRSAVNTCLDINDRFGVTENDKVFAISSLSFDLSVYDIFGVLGAGGTVVMCKPNGTRDPEYWWSMIRKHNVTVWNTVPTSFEMLMETCPADINKDSFPLQKVFLSGDAIRMEFARFVKQTYPQIRLIAMGGATEASIWSNYHEVIPCRSPHVELVPYGVPLGNQTMYVLDSQGEYRQTDVTGTIYIGGVGVAVGYFRDPQKTEEKFIHHAVFGRLYDTGDVGRYMENGEIQIIGRRDAQVKVGGHRVELAEIENCVEQVEYVKRAAVVRTEGAANRLVGFVQLTGERDQKKVEIELRNHVASHLPDYMATQTWIVLDSVPLTGNGKIDRKRLVQITNEMSEKSHTSDDNSSVVGRVIQVARDLLGDTQNRLQSSSSLVEFGMTSLAAIRFSKKLSDELNIQLPYTLVFNYPTPAHIASYISSQSVDKEMGMVEEESAVQSLTSERLSTGHVPIAVIGMSCRLPGGVTNPEEFWDMLVKGTDCITDVPKSRFDIDEIYNPKKETLGKSYTRKGAFISDVEWFDHDFFNISLTEAKAMDPQQRLLLEVAYEAFMRAGYTKTSLMESDTGVFVGQMNYDWMLVSGSAQSYAGTGISPSITANRLSFALGLRGPSITIDTACSSSLVAVDLAVEKLKAKKCTTALVAGVNLILHPEPYLITCAAEMLSLDSRCATFDASANGIARGEGIGCVVLKRLDQALADGDEVMAVIKGTCVNQDGRSASLTAPSGIAQQAAIRTALREAGLTGRNVDYVECHGTGTNLGDPIEVEALSKVLSTGREKRVVLGSVKTNIGHLEGAAGIVGLMKTVLVLKNRQVPPNLHFKQLNPKIDISSFKGCIPTKLIQLDDVSSHNTQRQDLVAGVSSFGFGGTNAHAILQSYTSDNTETENQYGRTAWLFTGQGSQHTGMGKDLYNTNATFKQALDTCAEHLKDLIDIPLLALLFDESLASHLGETRYSQPALLSVEYALSQLWLSRGVSPSLVIGHSIGEYAAAVACGVMRLEDALMLVTRRGHLMDELCEHGTMAAVFCSVTELCSKLKLGSNVVIASINGPTSIVLSGNRDEINDLVKQLNVAHQWLDVKHAFHSPAMHAMQNAFRSQFDKIVLKKPNPEIVFISTATGAEVSDELTSREYWVDQIALPVNYMSAVVTASKRLKIDTFLELGARPVLIPLAKRIVSRDSHQWVTHLDNDVNINVKKTVSKNLYKRKYIPWTIPSMQTSKKNKTNVKDLKKDYLFKLQWEDHAGSPVLPMMTSDTLKDVNATLAEESGRILIISFSPFVISNPKFLNIVHDGKCESSNSIEYNSDTVQDVRNLSTDMKYVVRQKKWSTILFSAHGGDMIEVVELGMKLLKEVHESTLNHNFMPDIWFVTHLNTINNTEVSDFNTAGLWATVRTAHTEMPDLKVSCVEMIQSKSAEEVYCAIDFIKKTRIAGEAEFRIGGDMRLKVPRLVKISDDEAASEPLTQVIKKGVTYVITGGLGSLGMIVAKWLADCGADYIALVSRSIPSQPSKELSALIEREDVNVKCFKCDVAVVEDLKSVQEELSEMLWPKVGGVIHAAGVLSDGLITSVNAENIKKCFDVKVKGATNLRFVFAPQDFLVLFSSAASLLGAAGQGVYAAANATMDLMAESWGRAGERVASIQWGPWCEAGMSVTSGAINRFKNQGYGLITNSEGINIIHQLLSKSLFGVYCASPFNWEKFRTSNNIFKNFQLSSVNSPANKTLKGKARVRTVQQKVHSEEKVLSMVRQMTHDVLGSEISETTPLMESGLSSLDLVSLRQSLAVVYPGVSIPSSVVFNYPTIRELSAFIYSQLPLVNVAEPDEAAGDEREGLEDGDLEEGGVEDGGWEKLNDRTSGRPLFLVGGVLGTASGTFQKLSQQLPCPVYAIIPDLSQPGVTVEGVASDLIRSMRRIQRRGRLIVGGLSFGGIIALEMAAQLEEKNLVECVILLDPRHTPPFQMPDMPATFESLMAAYTPSTTLHAKVYLLQCEQPDFSKLSPLLKEAARSFQTDEVVQRNLKVWCSNLDLVNCPGHHFKFLNNDHVELGQILMNLQINFKLDDQDRNQASGQADCEPVAVVGMSCRLPGGVTDPESFWKMLMEGRDCISEVPLSRFDMDEIYSAERGAKGKSYTRRAGFMDDVEWFDCDMFSISQAESREMDPQQRVLMEAGYEAFYSAGYDLDKLRGTNTGVFVGQANYDWMTLNEGDNSSPYFGAGTSASISANRISYVFGLQGPSMTMDTACSSSLVALDFAVEKLRSCKCDMALVAGVNVILNGGFFVTASATNALSHEGRCATFDSGADGYVRGEGVGCVVLKRLSEARTNGDHILALIKGTSVNHDGRASSLTAPNGKAQERVIRNALTDAGIQPADVDYVECHGTGTTLGDPVEVDALKAVLGAGRAKPVVLGSVKSNVGHLEGAAGITGVIKTILTLQHGEAPATVHFKKLNPNINLEGFKAIISNNSVQLSVATNKTQPLTAGVSSFGFGGTNAHAVLQQWRSDTRNNTRSARPNFRKKFLPWRRLPHPLVYKGCDAEGNIVGLMRGERARLWDDHQIDEGVWFPASSHLTMIAGAYLMKERIPVTNQLVELRDVIMTRPMKSEGGMEVVCRVGERGGAELGSRVQGVLNQAASCTSVEIVDRSLLPNINIEEKRRDIRESVNLAESYQRLEELGVKFGKRFRNISEAWRGESEAIARLTLPDLPSWERALSLIHPVMLDAAFQLLGICSLDTSGACVPFHIDRALISTVQDHESLWVYAKIHERTSSSLVGDVTLTTSSGQVVAHVEGLLSRRVWTDVNVAESLFETKWISLPGSHSRFETISNTDDGLKKIAKNSENLIQETLLFTLCEQFLVGDIPSWKRFTLETENHKSAEDISTISSVNLEQIEAELKQEWRTIVLMEGRATDPVKSSQTALLILKAAARAIESGGNPEVWFISEEVTTEVGCGSYLQAMARTAKQEIPTLNIRFVVVPTIKQISRVSTFMECIRDLSLDSNEMEYRLSSDGSLSVMRLIQAETVNSADVKQLELNQNSLYVISGGSGAMAEVVTKWLVQKGVKHILLLSRSRPGKDVMRLAEGQRSVIEWVQCDVTSLESVRAACEKVKTKSKLEVAGVFHTAGVLLDGTISTLDVSTVQELYDVKVRGAENIHNIFTPSQFSVLFSSAAATFGSAGQINYALANAAMDDVAKRWMAEGERVLSVQWGAWSEAGMAVDKGALKRAERQGFGKITTKLGLNIIEKLLSSERGGVYCATPVDWTRMTVDLPILKDLKKANQSNAVKRNMSSPIHVPVSLTAQQIKSAIDKVTLEVLGVTVSEDASLIESGLDSLGAVEFRNLLSAELNVQLPSVLVYNHPTPADIIEFLVKETPTSAATLGHESKVMRSLRNRNEPIAVIGMACKFPGDSSNPDQFWQMLEEARDCVTEIPMSRFDMEGVYSTERGNIGKSYTNRAAFMSDVEWFDHEFFNISHSEAVVMDPQQRLLIEVGYEALHGAGYNKSKLKGSNTGVFVGQANYDWMTMNNNDITSPYFGSGASASITANRVSFALGLRGPSMTVDTACSSSLVSLDIAVEKLRSGKCSMALVGGVNVMLSTLNFVGSCAANMLSVQGRCATFDESADGYCRGEGVGCLVLKPLSQAETDGDNILALIRGTAVNQDGRSATLTAPNGVAQESVISSALSDAEISGRDVDYVECHGTGTSLGDPIEVNSIASVLGHGRQKPLVLGAVKSNIGHLEGAAGVAGVIKVIKVLQNRKVPPVVHFKSLNPKIDLEAFNGVIPVKTSLAFDEVNNGKTRNSDLFAGVSSFGFGGTNAHVILQTYPHAQEHTIQPVEYNRKFLPWRKLTHPLIYRQDSEGRFVALMSGERRALWDDHKVFGETLFPAASHLTMIAGAVMESQRKRKDQSRTVELSDVIVMKPLRVEEGMIVKCCMEEEHTVTITSDDDVYVKASHVEMVKNSAIPFSELTSAQSRCTESIDLDECYQKLAAMGIEFGPRFRNIQEAHMGNNEAVAKVKLASMESWERSLSLIHPALLDAAFQLLGLCALKNNVACVPFHVRRVLLTRMIEQVELWVHATLSEATSAGLVGDVTISTSGGKVVAVVEGITSRRLQNVDPAMESLYEVEWIKADKTSDRQIEHQSGESSKSIVFSFNQITSEEENWKCVTLTNSMTSAELELSNNGESWSKIILVADSKNGATSIMSGIKLIKECSERKKEGRLPDIWFILCDTSEVYSVAAAGLSAVAKTARLEIPELRLYCVHVSHNVSNCSEIKSLLESVESATGRDERDFKMGSDDILVPRLTKHNPVTSDQLESLDITDNGMYLISGGLGGLGITVAKWLVENGAKYIGLLSRSGKNSAKILKEITQGESRVEWFECDVSDSTSVSKVQETLKNHSWPEVKGIFHAAGSLADGTIKTIDPVSLLGAYQPKVQGAKNLRHSFQTAEFLILFSSASGVFGSPGQVNYSASNAAMDALAQSWRGDGQRVISIQWGAWSETGMAVNSGAIERIQRQGFGAITNKTGMNIVKYVLQAMNKGGVICATPISWHKIKLQMPLLSNFKPLKPNSTSSNNARLNLKATTPMVGKTIAEIRSILSDISQEVLGKIIDEDAPLMEAGLDSLGAVEFRNRLSAKIGIELPSIFVYNHPSLAQMIIYLSSHETLQNNEDENMQDTEKVKPEESIAVISMACKLPGGVESPEELWSMIQAGQDCVVEIPQSRFDMSSVYDANKGVPGKSYTNRAALMSGVDWFDHDLFGISHSEAKSMDPQQRLLLEVGYEALVKAGYDKGRLRGSDTGVFVGQMNYDWMMMNGYKPTYGGTGFSPAITANRMSYIFGLNGPSMTIDTACSSSLVAVDSAVEKLRTGKCSLALVGGVNVILQAANFVGSSAANMLSTKGRCATFDQAADGYCRGEGVACVVLKPLSKAVRDKDEILAVIKGSAVNQDGRSASLTAPNGQAQVDVISRALREARLSGRDVDYVECHGTGTELGDPIEIEALREMLGQKRDKPVVLGALKTNIGHLEGAAGLAGLIKTVLVLKNGQAPRNIHFKTLNPKINLEGFNVTIPTETVVIKGEDKKELTAGVSSFGFGGTNAHVILQSWNRFNVDTKERTESEMEEKSTDNVVWLFTGQGSQYTGMGRELYEQDSVFKSSLDKCAELLKGIIDIPLLSLLFETSHTSQLNETRYSQPAILSVEYAISEMWLSRGVSPGYVIGHSIGEYTAAVLCGVMEIEDALRLVARRGRLMDERCQRGAMAAVFQSAEELKSRLPNDVYISAMNGPTLTVLSGKRERLDEVMKALNLPHKHLQVEHGFHSPLINGMLEDFKSEFSQIKLNKPSGDIGFISTVTGDLVTEELITSQYWVEQIALPVKFHNAMIKVSKISQVCNYIEIGPKPVLIPMARRFIKSDKIVWITSQLQELSKVNLTKVKSVSKPAVVFNRKHLPWNTSPASAVVNNTQASPVEQSPGKELIQFKASDCLYESVWERIENVGEAARGNDAANKKCLIISHGPIKVIGTKWVNAMHVANLKSVEHTSDSRIETNLRQNLEEVLQRMRWESVIVLTSESEDQIMIELSVKLLKFAEKNVDSFGDIFLVCQKKHSVADVKIEEDIDYTGADLRALARTARMEISNLNIYTLVTYTLNSAVDLSEMLQQIQTHTDKGEREFRVTDMHGLQVSRLIKLKDETEKVDRKNLIHPKSTYVITGGLGALGLVLADWLVEKGATHIVLLSRSKRQEEPEQLKSLRTKSGTRATIEWMQCDVSNVSQVLAVRQALRERKWPETSAVFHSAGLLIDSTITNLDLSSLSSVRSPKVKGAINLKNILSPTDFLMLFSSAAGVFGSPGQVSYALANAEMDCLAQRWSQQGTRVLSVQWGAWSEGGMAAKNGAILRARKQGFDSIDNKLGMEIIESLLKNQRTGVICAAPIVWNEVRTRTAFTSNLVKRDTSVEMFSPRTHEAETVVKSVDVRAVLHEVAVDVLGFKVEDEAALVEAGMDSLGAVEFRNQLSEKIGRTLHPGILFDYPTIGALAQHLGSTVQLKIAPAPTAMKQDNSLPILVVGGGLAGLSAAKMLRKAGNQVVIMESRENLGGVWKTWANATSKLQIDAPSYDFACFDMDEKTTWPTIYPTRQHILEGVEEIVKSMGSESVMLKTKAEKVTKVSSSEYTVEYSKDGVRGDMKVGGVVAMTGGLHKPREVMFPGEEAFRGRIALGIRDDMLSKDWQGARVVIVGHGAFAVENMRTALQGGATHVTILCRKRSLVVSSFLNWLLNSTDGNLPVKQVIETMRPLYSAAGIDVESLSCFSRDKEDYHFDQATVPAASDLYFIAQALGKLEVIEDEVDHLISDTIVTKKGKVIKANILLKCLGFQTDRQVLGKLFGEDYSVEGFWINGDRNLFTYNDGEHLSRKVKSLLCSSYLFFAQSYTSAYIHYRNNPEEFERVSDQLRGVGAAERHNRLLVQLWDFLSPAKSNVAKRTRQLCPFNRFMAEREKDWKHYIQLLSPTDGLTRIDMWQMVKQVVAEARRREPNQLIEERQNFGELISAVYRPLPRYRVLFLHGQGTNASLANYLLESNGWTGQLRERIEFIIPDAPHQLNAFTNSQQLSEIGLSSLVNQSIYDTNQIYREWGADFDWFADVQYGRTSTPPSNLQQREGQWNTTIKYVQAVIEKFGPFDGIAGFCEGAAVAAVMLRLQRAYKEGRTDGVDFGLERVRFFIGLAGWRNPYHEHKGLFDASPLSIPSLHVSGKDDMDIFRKTHPTFVADFKEPLVYEHGGKHVYPLMSPSLKTAITRLLHRVD